MPVKTQPAIPVFVPGTPVQIPHPPANPQPQNNLPGPADIQAQIKPPPPVKMPAQMHPAKMPAKMRRAIPVFIPSTPVQIPHPPANPQSQNNLPGPADVQGHIDPPPAAKMAAQMQPPLPMFIPSMPVQMPHPLADLEAPNNRPDLANLQPQDNLNYPGPADVQAEIDPPPQGNMPGQIQPPLPPSIPRTPEPDEDAPVADIQGAEVLIREDPGFEYPNVAQRVPRTGSDLSQISEYFRDNLHVYFVFTY